MLHMESNIAILGNKKGQELLSVLEQRLPPGWVGEAVPEPASKGGRFRPDFLFKLKGPGGKTAKLVVECKTRIEPMDVPALKERLDAYVRAFGSKTTPLVFAPFLSRSTQRKLREAGIPYADKTGNIRIMVSQPGLYIETQGAERNPDRKDRPARSLKGAKAGRIVRTLCDGPPPFSVRKAAEAVGINPGYVSRVMTFLESEALIEREKRGPITVVHWRRLIERWAEDYSFLGSNRVVSYLEPGDIVALPKKLAAAGKFCAVTGSAAAATVAPVAPTRLVAAYVESPEAAAVDLGLRPAESGANVLLAEPYDPVVFERTRKREGVPYAALSQAAVDLLTGPGRGPSEGQALLDWMQTHESDWRG